MMKLLIIGLLFVSGASWGAMVKVSPNTGSCVIFHNGKLFGPLDRHFKFVTNDYGNELIRLKCKGREEIDPSEVVHGESALCEAAVGQETWKGDGRLNISSNGRISATCVLKKRD